MSDGNGQFKLLTWLLGLIATVIVAGVPWAFTVHGKVSAIQTKLDNLEVPPRWFLDQVQSQGARVGVNDERLDILEQRMLVVERSIPRSN